jgi:hypothetical protein
MKYKNIVNKKTYIKDGEEKAVWQKVGTLKETDDGKQFVEIFALGDFYVFEEEERKEKPTVEEKKEEAKGENIPF